MLTFTVLGGYCNLRFEHALVLGQIVLWDCFRSHISFAGFDWLLLLLRFRLGNWIKIHLLNSSEPVRSEGKLPLISPPVISPLGYKLPSYKSPSVISPPNPPSYKPLQLKAPPPHSYKPPSKRPIYLYAKNTSDFKPPSDISQSVYNPS